jgi:hypothetical protein
MANDLLLSVIGGSIGWWRGLFLGLSTSPVVGIAIEVPDGMMSMIVGLSPIVYRATYLGATPTGFFAVLSVWVFSSSSDEIFASS